MVFILRCIEQDLYRVDPISPWDGDFFYLSLTTEQLEAFRTLQDLLDQKPRSSSQALCNAITIALRSLYLPSNCFDMLTESFLSPVIAFVCFCSVHSEGGFCNPKRLTSIYAKTQFGIRLFLLKEGQAMYNNCRDISSTQSEQYEKYMA